MLTVYHLNESRSLRVLWLLEELGVPYQMVRFQRDASRRAPAELREVHPLGKAPVVRDGELVLAESGAIVEYLVERHSGGRLAPRPTPAAWACTCTGSTSRRAPPCCPCCWSCSSAWA